MKQLIFVVETSSNNQSDDRYLKKLINSRYDLSSNEIKLQFIHMDGKSYYNDKTVISKIKKYIDENKGGENYITYCFDTDEIDSEYKYKEEFKKEKEYCDAKNYFIVWFNYDIEYVLLGKRVESNKKKQESIKYYNKEQVIPIKHLFGKNEEIKGYSNIFLILDKLLPLKKVI